MFKRHFAATIAALAMSASSSIAFAADSFKVCWSHYAGWEPYALLETTGILPKWEAKYGIDIEVTLINDYIESINLYTAGEFDACTMTNMDALTIPAIGGVDSTAIIMGDYSNGNDGIVLKVGSSVKDLKDRTVDLVEFSVSHYLLSRALDKHGMSELDLTVRNASDVDIPSIFRTKENAAVVTWNPPLQTVRNMAGANLVFDSSEIPEEVMDLLIVKTDTDERFKKAITGAWYELMSKLSQPGTESKHLISLMAANAGATDAEFRAQLKTTAMFYTPQEAANVFTSEKAAETMDFIRNFSFDKGLFGQGASTLDFVGIELPGKVLGDADNVTLRFDPTYMQMAADGKL
ncbi:putative urea ABC transporter substrate-binding protein [Marinomonas sp. THO17]|uniref:putative urea ABC transporter substrate-binding protein n=1 Tax=Marinomonas sp. THO17 TaxID=3149048 RepID=UPI00336BB104